MALTCNIDQRGRRHRYRIGFALVALGTVAGVVAAFFASGAVPWLIGVPLVAGGAFAIFEAQRGWCAVRALGFKTPV